jgi:hypothetical protein
MVNVAKGGTRRSRRNAPKEAYMNDYFHQEEEKEGVRSGPDRLDIEGSGEQPTGSSKFHEITKQEKCATIERRLVTFLACGLER